MSPPARFCARCGAPAIESASHCARCGVVFAVPSSPTAAVRAASADPGRSKMPSLLVGLAACTVGGFFFLVCGGIVAAVAIPNFMKAQATTKSQAAQANLKALWAAEQAWAAAHDGEFLEFYVDEYEPTDENLRRLRIDLGDLTYSYEATYDSNDVFVISAIGNIDEDESSDEWELLSDNPVPFHLYDDVTEQDHYQESSSEYADDDDDEEWDEGVEGGVVGGVVGGVGGLGLKGVGESSSDVEAKSTTARANLVAIWQGQQAYKLKKKSFMAFDKGGAATWAALGLAALPEAENHTFSASVSGGALTLSATANLDADAFEDEWSLSSADGIPVQVKNDALNLDLSELSNILREFSKKEAE